MKLILIGGTVLLTWLLFLKSVFGREAWSDYEKDHYYSPDRFYSFDKSRFVHRPSTSDYQGQGWHNSPYYPQYGQGQGSYQILGTGRYPASSSWGWNDNGGGWGNSGRPGNSNYWGGQQDRGFPTPPPKYLTGITPSYPSSSGWGWGQGQGQDCWYYNCGTGWGRDGWY